MSSTPSNARPAQLGERRRAPDRREELVDVPLVHRGHRDDLLREDVERIARIAGRLDRAVVHRLGDGGARDEVAAELREDHAFAHRVDLVAAAADALQAARDRRRRLDLDDEIDRAHVDAELERRGGDERAQARRAFSRSSISTRCARAIEPWCERTSVSPASSLSAPASRSASRRLLTKISVERCARISSSSRGWIADQIDGRAVADRRGPARDVVGRRQPRHVLDRHLDRQLQRLPRAGVDDRDRPVAHGAARGAELGVDRVAHRRPCGRSARSSCVGRRPSAGRGSAPPRNRATSSSGRCVAERPMRCGGRAQRAASRSSDSARCAPRLVGTSAWISSMMIVSTARSASRAFDVSSRYSDSGVVIRMSAGSR